jgi:DNA uptake protein ComE-like DNA-binding protein
LQKDINSATQEDLMKVYGIGQVLSERILKMKEAWAALSQWIKCMMFGINS